MPAVNCPICLSHITIEKFVVFPCGHGLCIDCKKCIFQGSVRPKCPNCRIHISDRDAHPVFLDLVDSKVAFTSNLVDDLDKMDNATPLLSIKKVGQKLKKVLQGSLPVPDAMTALIEAVEDFNERIIPLFTKVEVQSHQITTLRQSLLESHQETENLQDQLKKAELLFQRKSTKLEMELKETKRNGNEASRLAEIVKIDLSESLDRWKKQVSELTAENKRYKNLLKNRCVESARWREGGETMSDATQVEYCNGSLYMMSLFVLIIFPVPPLIHSNVFLVIFLFYGFICYLEKTIV